MMLITEIGRDIPTTAWIRGAAISKIVVLGLTEKANSEAKTNVTILSDPFEMKFDEQGNLREE